MKRGAEAGAVHRPVSHDDRLARNPTLREAGGVGGRSIMLDSVTPERDTGTAVSMASDRFHFSLAPSGTDAG